jgi:hypothetical protein
MSNCEVKVKRSDEEELFHSDTFLGDEFSDEMYHWKYIKKKKVNGKWRYYYDTTELDKFDKEATVTSKTVDEQGTKITKTTEYKKSNNLFDPGERKFSFSTSLYGGGSYESEKITKYQGKLSRAYAKAEKKIYNTFYSGKRKNTKVSSLKNKAKKGKNFIKNFFKIH